MRRITIVAILAAFLCVVSPAQAARTECHSKALVNAYSANYHAVKKAFTKRAPGRNIRKWGLSKKRASKCRHLRKSLNILRGMRVSSRAASYLRTGAPSKAPAGTQTVYAGGTLESIAQCESGGNPATNTGNGFYGKYQFTLQTWASVGGSGNPAAASEAEQNKRAAMLYAREGSSPWPVCGR